MMLPALPDYDHADPVESAIINGLVRTWSQRATVRKQEVDLDDLFDPAKADYPEELIPFHSHDRYLALDENTQNRLRAWAWIAYNKSVMDIEQFVVNPGFGMLLRDEFGVGFGDKHKIAAVQAMVDEEYHTLMHLNASALTRRRRQWALPDTLLPRSRTVREHDAELAAAAPGRPAAIVRLAYTAAAETSISGYLALMSENDAIQPVNCATVALHRRDELCHSSVTGELLKIVFGELDSDERRQLVAALGTAVEAFTGSDFSTWAAILRAERVEGADQIIRDVEDASVGQRVVQDCSAIRRLCRDLGVEHELGLRW
jgi:alpha-N-dichloroacetyl-p-aminophenylserinol N-oxygenase